MTATVTEDGTDKLESTSKYIHISTAPYAYVWNYRDRYIKPKLPYRGTFLLTDISTPLNNSHVQLCYKVMLATVSTCSNFTLDSDNRVEFTIPPIKNITQDSVVGIQVRRNSFKNVILRYFFLIVLLLLINHLISLWVIS